MAFPTITKQPVSDSMRSVLFPIQFKITEATANTLYVVAVVEYDDNGSWEDLGTGIRLAQDINDSTIFFFDASQICSTLISLNYNDWGNNNYPTYTGNRDYRMGAWGRIYGYTGVATGGAGNMNFKEKSVWSIKVRFYREYLDTTTGLIVTDPNESLSNGFYITELGLSQQEMFSTRDDLVFDMFHMIQNPAIPVSTYRFLTNCPMPIETNLSASNFLSLFWSKEQSDTTSQNNGFVVVNTYNNTLGMVGSHLLLVEVTLGPLAADSTVWSILADTTQGMFPCGLRDMAGAIESDDPWIFPRPSALMPGYSVEGYGLNESMDGLGTSFNNVDTYTVNVIGGDSFFATSNLAEAVFINTEGPNYAVSTGEVLCGSTMETSKYPNLVLHFKNRLGGYDRFESFGTYTIKKKIQFDTYDRRSFRDNPDVGLFDKWTGVDGSVKLQSNNYDKYSVQTTPLSSAKAEWLTEMFGSTEVMIEIPSTSAVGTRKLYSNVTVRAINIDAGSVEYHDTDENKIEISFTFITAKESKVPRN